MEPKSATELVAAAKQRVENLDVDQVAAEIEQGATVIDLREPEELAKTGVIPGAIHVPRGMLEFRADPTSPYHNPALDPSQRVILHCASGGRSALGAAALADMGYENVAHLDGGITAWTAAGRPTDPYLPG
jgi:rhodanese-related sulfurtransferase